MRIRWLDQSLEDMEAIHAYLVTKRPGSAQRTMVRIYDSVLALKLNPLIGRPGREPEMRELIVSRLPYIVFYRIVQATIEVVYVRHGARSFPPR